MSHNLASRLRLRIWITGPVIAIAGALLLSGCLLSADSSIEKRPDDPRAQDLLDKIRNIDLTPRALRADQPPSTGGAASPRRATIVTSEETEPRESLGGNEVTANGDGYDLNFENAPVTSVAKVVLGDILGVGYSIDPRVQGTVTLASGRPISKGDALFVLENALRMSNVALVRDRAGYRVIPSTDAIGTGNIDRNSATPGYGVSVVPLRYVSAQTVFKLLDAFGMKANAIRADQGRNLIVVQGSGGERASAVDTILSFDADWMKGQSVGIFPVRNGSPEPMVAELEKIMDAADGGVGQNMIKLQPINRMNAILVVSKKPEFLKRAGTWIARLDNADIAGDNLKVYQLRYSNARQMALVLNDVMLGKTQSAGNGLLDPNASQIAPGAGLSASSSDPASRLGMPNTSGSRSGDTFGSGGFGTFGQQGSSSSTTNISSASSGLGGSNSGSSFGARFGGQGQTGLLGQQGATPGGLPGASGPGGSGGSGNPPAVQNVRITADVTNNTLLVYANAENQRVVEQTIRQIDRPQRQVAIEATIAEVTLNDTLNYGVQFFLQSKDLGLKANTGSAVNTLSTAVNAAGNVAINRVIPGFNLLIGSEAQPRVILDALHTVSNVKVLSNPSLVVLDNQVATLQVGDQVPISTGSATVLTTNNTIVNTIDYRNTGIILRILPRSNANGNVVLEIEQEISNVGSTDQNTLTPIISQRRVKSSIAVASGQTVLLAGLISDQDSTTRAAIPGLDRLPGLLGDAFGHQSFAKKRTELILLIRPTVIRDAVDAHVVAEELRSKMNGRLIGSTLPIPTRDAPNVRPQ